METSQSRKGKFVETIIVEENNVRLDRYIAQKYEKLSRTMIQKLIEDGNITVNGLIKKMSYKVQQGDKISVQVPEVKEVDLKPQEIPIEVIYEDKDIIVVNKPKGLVVHPANRKSRWNISKCYYGHVQGKFI